MSKYHFIIIIIIAVTFSACSTVNRGSSDYFRADTVPQGAKVTTTLPTSDRRRNPKKPEYLGCEPTPCAIKVPRRSEFVATFEQPGYEPTELYIRSSSMRGGSTATVATNLASASGAGLAVGGMVATASALATATTNTVFTVFSGGLFNPGLTTNTSGIASSGAAAGLAVGAGMIAIDVASGANLNTFPNPVVIEMSKTDTPTEKDPLVNLYKDMEKTKETYRTICRTRKKDRDINGPTCEQSREKHLTAKANFTALKKQQMQTLRTALKAARKRQ